MKNIKSIFILAYSLLLFLLAFFVKTISRKPEENERLYLIGSNYGNSRDENATSLYQYIAAQGHTVFYIGNRSESADTLKRGSFKSFSLFFRSNAVFFTHSLSDILPFLHKAHWVLKYFSLPQKIFTQHGVIGLKSQVSADMSMAYYLSTIYQTFDKMVVSSQVELEIVAGLGVPRKKLAITGLPRFDSLTDSDTGPNVLVFLTWSPEAPYQRKLNEILDSEAIKLLEASGLNIIVKQHTMMQRASGRKDNSTANAPSLQTIIKSAALLITDNSSVAWDFFYKGSEVIFYKPDPDWLISDNKALNARIANSDLMLIQLSQKFINRAAEDTLQVCDFKDHQNAARVFSLARKLP